jgi:acyl-CoA synthetase (AMP-forming)/AMP-acid ligase II
MGVRPGDRVGIYLRKSIDAVAALYAALEAGAAYVPVDPGAPVGRNAFILSDCAVKAIVIESRFEASLRAELELLGAVPELLVTGFVEAPDFGEERALRQEAGEGWDASDR